MPNRKKYAALVFFLFLSRLFYGLCQAQWNEPDVAQTYLIGLKYHTTRAWPWFGPDLYGLENNASFSQIPGALEGLLIGLPFRLLPIPEAPFILLNLLSMAGIVLLAWYIHRRIPSLSLPWLTTWISVIPWSLYMGTHVISLSYDYLPSVIFFIGFLETLPIFTRNLVPSFWCNAGMGLSLFWIMQFHFSYVYLIPLTTFSLGTQVIRNRSLRALLPFALGSLPTAAFLVPTFFKYGLNRGDVVEGLTTPFSLNHLFDFWTIPARFLSLVCLEVPRFLGAHTLDRVNFLIHHPWLFPLGLFFWIAGILQAVLLLVFWFKTRHTLPLWKETKWLVFWFLAMVYVSFWFTIKPPAAHIYFVFFPFILLYSCYVWSFFSRSFRWRLFAKSFVACAVVFQLGYAVAVIPTDSFYAPQESGVGLKRDIVVQALRAGNYRIMGDRRSRSLY